MRIQRIPRDRRIDKRKEGDMRIAYLTTTYPAVSHTFIRRELREIERRGHEVLRLAIRKSGAPLVDPIDMEESAKTNYCVSYPLVFHLMAACSAFFSHPLKFLDAFFLTLALGSRGEKGLLKHLAYLAEACTFFAIMRKHSIQHVHAHFGTNVATIARLIARIGGPTYSFTVHGPAEFDSPAGIDLAGKVADAAFVVAISDFCSAQLRRWCAIPDWSKIKIVHCTVGGDFFDSATRVNPESRSFSCVGRLSPQKGQLVLVEAFSRIIKAGLDARLVFVGDGELRKEIEGKIASEGIGDRVLITGYVSEADVRKHISESRALVIPSFAEGLPMVIMEAFAIGRPVISTYVAGIPELVRPGENGWLVPAANTELLSAAMAESLRLPASRMDEMATNGRELTRLRHSTVTEGQRLEELFLERLGRDA
jgi:colanic acid/amylovoran biosynthesis glycosyltransferase